MSSNYKEIESKIPRYEDLLKIKIVDNDEGFVYLDEKKVPNGYLPELSDMKEITGERILVRQSVCEKLISAQEILHKKNKDLTLFVTYGYRGLEIQIERFMKFLKYNINQFYDNPVDLYNAIHPFIAVPSVAGHPTGGSVDITIKNLIDQNFLNFGSKQYDYSTKDCYVFVDSMSDEAMKNRMLLRECMTEAGFAPYDGEWWHFSYGERDWAYYVNAPYAIYNQVKHEDIKIIV